MENENESVLIYIAKKLKDALRIEAALTESQIEYLVEPDTYAGGVIFRSQRTGAFFYVDPENEAKAKEVIQNLGFKLD